MRPLALPLSACLLAFASANAANTYFIHPDKGDDANTGASASAAWKSFAKLDSLNLGPGDKVVVAPGIHTMSLHPKAHGSANNPAVIEFLPGTHEFAPDKAIRRPLFVSNACDAPSEPKPLGILVEDCAHLRLQGAGVEGEKKTLLLMGGRMIEDANLRSENIAYEKLAFDLKRPTVSEFRVSEVSGDTAIIAIAEGSTYEIKDGEFRWTGDIGSGAVMVQEAIPAEGRCWRRGTEWDPFKPSKSEEIAPGKVRVTCPAGSKAFGMEPGHQFQFRHIRRDSVGMHNADSRDIRFEDCDIYALTNMGVVSQFTENLTFRRVRVAPPAGTIRTCPAWADIFHFSNCRGLILIEGCVESGMQDDAVNCHGTHLRIVGKPAENRLTLRYMHSQTYGFAPYRPGDEIAVVDHKKLRELPGNPRRKVTACEQSDKAGKEWTVTLDGPAPAFAKNDVTDNITWHPDIIIRNCTVDMDPVRGYLPKTRGKVLLEKNTVHSAMAGVLLEDDANSWFESTSVRDLTLRQNTFLGCGVHIAAQTKVQSEPVHENILIENNTFKNGKISARSVKNLTIAGNRFSEDPKSAIRISDCELVKTEGNSRQ